MARKKVKIEDQTEVKQKQFKLSDSYGSLVLGFIVVVVVIGILIFALRDDKKTEDTSSSQDEITEETAQDIEMDETGQKIYTVKKGDDLWHIAQNIYNDGYKWVEILKTNEIANPSLIEEGQKLVIPDLEEKEPIVSLTEMPTPTAEPTKAEAEEEKEGVKEDVVKKTEEKITGSQYTVKKGDYLWEIAVRAYGDGYKWVDIARANKLDNPNMIHKGNVFKLPR